MSSTLFVEGALESLRRKQRPGQGLWSGRQLQGQRAGARSERALVTCTGKVEGSVIGDVFGADVGEVISTIELTCVSATNM